MELFGIRLKALRQSRSLLQDQLAEMLDVGKATVSGYERSTSHPSIEVLIRICKVFNVSSDYMLGLSDTMQSHLGNLTDEQCKDVLRIILYIEQLNSVSQK